MFDKQKIYKCPIGENPEIGKCASCVMERELAKSAALLKTAEAKNVSSGTAFSDLKPQRESEVTKISTKERLAVQRQQNIEANDQAYEMVQARQKVSPQNMYWPPYNPTAPEGEKYIDVEYVEPIVSIAVLSLEEAQEFYQSLGGKETIGNVRSYSDLTKGGAEAYATAKGLGGLGVKASTKSINGKDWVIIRDFRKHQQTLMKGNKWGANNPKVIQAGLGLNDLKGATRYVKFNVGIEIAFAIGINAADYILRDDATLTELGVNTAGDLAKGFISLVGAALFTAVVVPTTVGVLFSGMTFAAASFILGNALDAVDENNGYSETMTEAVKEYFQ